MRVRPHDESTRKYRQRWQRRRVHARRAARRSRVSDGPRWQRATRVVPSPRRRCGPAEPIRDSGRKAAEPVRLCPAPGKPREAYWSGSVDLPNCTQSTQSTRQTCANEIETCSMVRNRETWRRGGGGTWKRDRGGSKRKAMEVGPATVGAHRRRRRYSTTVQSRPTVKRTSR